MNIQISGLHTTLTPSIEEYTRKRISSLSKFVGPDTLCDIELIKTTNHHRSGDIFKAEGRIHVNGSILYATSEKSDMYAAVDDLKDELERILVKNKDKKITAFRKGAQRVKNFVKHIRSFNHQ